MIADFAPSRPLRHVCQELWELFQGQHISCTVDYLSLQAMLYFVQQDRLRTVDVSAKAVGDVGAKALGVLKDFLLLHTLTLNLENNAIMASGAYSLGALKEAPSLRILSLNLRKNAVGPRGMPALLYLGVGGPENFLLHGLAFLDILPQPKRDKRIWCNWCGRRGKLWMGQGKWGKSLDVRKNKQFLHFFTGIQSSADLPLPQHLPPICHTCFSSHNLP